MRFIVAPGRAMAFVSVLLFLSTNTAFAHALPASTLIFSRNAEQLKLSVTVPIEELLIAANTLASVSAISPDDIIPESVRSQVEGYFSKHISLHKEGTGLPMAITTMSIDSASHKDVGTYAVLNLILTTELPGVTLDSLMLRYDAVMHEVRTHKAEVYWSDNSQNPQQLNRLMRFGFKQIDGEQQMLKLAFSD